LAAFGNDLKSTLQPLGNLRPDWEKNEFNLGSSIEDEPIRNLIMGLGSWRTVLPRKASDVVVRSFLKYGASAWVLRTSQVGGHDPDIEPIAPMTF
jgi:predicted Abi (CAAX) family protease